MLARTLCILSLTAMHTPAAPTSGPEAAEEGRANAVEMTTASAAYEPSGGHGEPAAGARDKRNKNLTNSDTLKSKKPGFFMQTWILTLVRRGHLCFDGC